MAKKTTKKKRTIKKQVKTLTHDEAKRTNIPTAEYQSVMAKDDQSPLRVAYERQIRGRNRDLDPQLVWRGKDEQDWSDLVVQAPPLFIQEKIHPKVLIDDLLRQTQQQQEAEEVATTLFADHFADFNGLSDEARSAEFYQHDANWTNRMILGDSLQVMASLAEREGLRGKVQCIYIDPPYGIKFNSNFQWSTTSRDVKDGNADHITREPEQVKAFRDTWRDGIHSYLTYLRDRLTVARDLLSNSGSIFVQISDENIHRTRCILDEVFGFECHVVTIPFMKKGNQKSNYIDPINDYILWYHKSPREENKAKFRRLFIEKVNLDPDSTWSDNLTSGGVRSNQSLPFTHHGVTFSPKAGNCWKTTVQNPDGSTPGMVRLSLADRILVGNKTFTYKRTGRDFAYTALSNWWDGLGGASEPRYVVETNVEVVKRCVLMSTDPGDLVLDPTCGSGTTAYVAEQWGRRWITIDTSRVALALARARIMGARYPYYLLADSRDGQRKEAEVTHSAPSEAPTHGNIRQGFVYERIPHIMLSTIAHNAEIDVIWDRYQEKLEPLREKLNKALGQKWEEWEIPRDADDGWPASAKELHADWWKNRIARQQEIDASIAAKADYEYLYDKPYQGKNKVRVAGPFTVETLSPHRVLAVDHDDELIDPAKPTQPDDTETDFAQTILENLKTAGVQQAHKEDKIDFTSLVPWPGHYICGEGRYTEENGEAGAQKRAAIFIGPEFGTVSRPDLTAAAREAGDADFDVLIACAFSYDAHSADFDKLGRIQVLKARMNADLHMAEDLKNTGKGNLFVIFGEPDIDIFNADKGQVQVKINGVDVFHPNTGEVRSDGAEGIACWFIDTDYNEESFFVRQAYFLGANDPYKSLKTTLKAEINQESWETLHSDTSRPFTKPKGGRIAVKVINHLGDEVMKVFKVD